MTLALGDALAMTVMRQKGFTRTDFGRLHPGGVARRAPKAGQPPDAFRGGSPLVGQSTSMHDAVLEMSAKRLGIVESPMRPETSSG
jgi:arabinose-5-phosphate isomerase